MATRGFVTKEQKQRDMVDTATQKILDVFRADMGVRYCGKSGYGPVIGLDPSTWWRWNKGGINKASLDHVQMALARIGYTLEAVPIGKGAKE